MPLPPFLAATGLGTLLRAPGDAHLLLLTRFLRMLSFGSTALILALHLAALGLSDARIGLFMTLVLAGDAGLSLALTVAADAVPARGRRGVLLVGAGGMVVAGGVFASAEGWWALVVAGVVGVVSPGGSEVGPFRAVEEAALAGLVSEGERGDVFAWWVVVGAVGTSVGLFAAGWVVEGVTGGGGEGGAGGKKEGELRGYRTVFWGYMLIGVAIAVLVMCLSERCEVGGGKRLSEEDEDEDGQRREGSVEQNGALTNGNPTSPTAPTTTNTTSAPAATAANTDDPTDTLADETAPLLRPPPPPTPPSRRRRCLPRPLRLSSPTLRTLAILLPLFALDSLASGMTPYSLINYYLSLKFSLPKSTLGTLMSATWLVAAASNVLAPPLSRRIGLVPTMLATHLPAALFLALLPLPTRLAPTAVLLVARAALGSVDQAPRSALVARLVPERERARVLGVVNVAKTVAQAGGPSVTGWLAGGGRFWVAFVAAGAVKGVYDLGLGALWVAGRRGWGGVRGLRLSWE